MKRRLVHVTAKAVVRAVLSMIAVAVLILLLLPAIKTRPRANPTAVTALRLSGIRVATQAFVTDHGPITTTDNRMIVSLLAGRRESVQGVQYLDISPERLDARGHLIDGWGTPIQFRLEQDGHRLIITSYGPDRKPGGGDDISVAVRMMPE